MATGQQAKERFFKTAWFAKAARKAHIGDEELCSAMQQVLLGQADDLGGGVYKKRLNKNLYRSILIARGGRYWIYTFLFAKQDRPNIDVAELKAFREQAALYAMKNENDMLDDLQQNVIVEIYNGKAKVQE